MSGDSDAIMTVSGDYADVDVPPPYDDDPGGEPPPDHPAYDDKFWTARPELGHVRDFARGRMCSPWALMGVVLVRASVAVPPSVVLPAIVGTEASLNLFTVLVGAPGSGKDAAIGAGSDAITWQGDDSATVALGSGEGIAHAYMRATRDGGVEQHTTAVMFVVPEIDSLTAIHKRQGSTVLGQLRQGWMGDRLGFQYADNTRRLLVPSHKYRMGLIAGAQPTRAGILLDDSDGGTPQRFLWMPATDPDAPERTPDPPEAKGFALPDWPRPEARSQTLRVVLPVCATAVDTIRSARYARLRGDGDALDGHALLQRLKVGAALAILNGRADVSDDDWDLAGVVMAKSDRVRDRVVEQLQRADRDRNRQRAEAEAQRSIVVGDRVREDDLQRVIRGVARKLRRSNDWTLRSDLRRGFTSTDREWLDPAVETLIETGQIEADDTGRGTKYRHRDGHR